MLHESASPQPVVDLTWSRRSPSMPIGMPVQRPSSDMGFSSTSPAKPMHHRSASSADTSALSPALTPAQGGVPLAARRNNSYNNLLHPAPYVPLRGERHSRTPSSSTASPAIDIPSAGDRRHDRCFDAFDARGGRHSHHLTPEAVLGTSAPVTVTGGFGGDSGSELSSTFKSNVGEFLKKYTRRDDVVPLGEGHEIGDYRLDGVLGVGGFSCVRKASRISQPDEVVAVKIVNKVDSDLSVQRAVREETDIWATLSHPNILALREVIETQSAICVVSELAHGGTLLKYAMEKEDGITESEARRFFLQLCSAVQYCHSMGYVHGDIKLDNILLDEDLNVKLGDFGLSSSMFIDTCEQTFSSPELFGSSLPSTLPESMSAMSFSGTAFSPPLASPHVRRARPRPQSPDSDADSGCGGTLLYCSPEMLRTGQVSAASDTWAIGVVLYALVAGQFPFDDDYPPRLQMLITRGRFDMPDVSEELQDLLRGLLQVDPAKRITLEQAMQHPWSTRGDDE